PPDYHRGGNAEDFFDEAKDVAERKGHDATAVTLRGLADERETLNTSLPNHAHSFRHSTHWHSPHRKLFRDDAAGNRAPSEGRDVLFHRRLSRAHDNR